MDIDGLYDRGCNADIQRKDRIFDKWYGDSWLSLWNKINLGIFFPQYIKSNLKKDFNLKDKTPKTLEENGGEYLHYRGIEKGSLREIKYNDHKGKS